MKTIITTITALLYCCMFSNYALSKQDDLNAIGIGLSYGFEMEENGLQLNGYTSLSDDFRLGGDFICWLFDDVAMINVTILEVNANLHYLIFNNNGFFLYGIGTVGFHYSKASTNILGPKVTSSSREIGVGLGLGAEYDFGKVRFFAEPRMFFTGWDQFTINGGLRVPF